MSNGTKMGKRRFTGIIALTMLLAATLSMAACSSSKSSQDSRAVQPQAMSGSAKSAPAAEAKNVTSDTVLYTTSSSDAKPAVKGAAAQAEGGIMPMAVTDDGMNRKVIYKAQVTMKVPSFESADEKLRDAIHQSGGYILNFSNSVNADEKGATYVIKVPADGFSSFIEQLRKIRKDLQLNMEGSDVTEEYVDLEARLQAKKTVEARLLAFMDKANGSDDLVRFSSQLADVQEQIEQIKGRMRYLDQNVAFSTVNLRLYEGTAESMGQKEKPGGLGERMTAALTGSARALGEFGQALLVFVAALLPVAAVAALVGVPVYAVFRGRRRARLQTAPSDAQIPDSPPENESH
ncbi:DUF4349 domain-containing protein [Cohnella pontilimi]|uniref:DUF4349 domain-containing protein n=1 Tax=Cohnella pontilimi TaxID=2564100 RepID=A0A4U0FEL4_9BACL|nr:DUF4349 domain-containing protein [Cohnella pontilimi]TJY43383.1 DUF4349 domain-containing protein [Cohnella pontilimi]